MSPESAATHFMYSGQNSQGNRDDDLSSEGDDVISCQGFESDSEEEKIDETHPPAQPDSSSESIGAPPPYAVMMPLDVSSPEVSPSPLESSSVSPDALGSVVSSVVSVNLAVSGDVSPVPGFFEHEMEPVVSETTHLGTAVMNMHRNPIEEAEQIIASLPIPGGDDDLKKVVRPDRMRQVLVLGATGRVGQHVVRFLADQLGMESRNAVIHCLIRANSLESARARLLASLESVCDSKRAAESVMVKCRVWLGDVLIDNFGMDEISYTKLCTRVEGVYNCISPDWPSVMHQYQELTEAGRDASYYALAAPSLVNIWSSILRFASTTKSKQVYAFLPLFYSFEMFVDTNPLASSHASVLESQIYDRFTLNRIALSPQRNLFGCMAWCKGVTESILKFAKQALEYSITIFKLPPGGLFSATTDLENAKLKRKPHFLWNVLAACVREGLMPDLASHVYALCVQPMDEAISAAVRVSVSAKRVHWIYHVIDDEQLSSFKLSDLDEAMNSLGIFLKRCSVEDWLVAVAERGPTSSVGPHLQNLQELFCNTCVGKPRSLSFSNAHFKHDLNMASQSSSWTPLKRYAKEYLRLLLHSHHFAPDSRGTLFDIADIRREAIKASGGLTDFGPHAQLCEEGWAKFMEALNDPANPQLTFWGRATSVRTLIVYLTTHLYLTERERICPVILEEEIKSPIFVVGLNRAGTTFVHSLLGQDTANNRCPVLLEMLFPYGEKGDYQPVGLDANDLLTWEQDPRRQAADDLVALQMGSELQKLMESVHHRYSTANEEDLVAFELTGRSYSFSAGFGVDMYVDWLLDSDAEEMRKGYAFHKRLFQHLQYQRPGKRWIFKMPWHLWTIETLFQTYPDAELVFVHRRPVSAVQSWCGLEKLLQSSFLTSVDLKRIGVRALRGMSRLVNKAMSYQQALAMDFVQEHPDLQPPQSFFYNIYFDSFVTSPIVCVGELYESLNLGPLSLAAETAMWSFIERAAGARHAVNRLNPQCELAEVGLTKREIKTAFSRYHDMYFDKAQRERRLQEYRTARAIRHNEVQREKHYDENGSMLIGGNSILKQAGFDQARKNVETIFSYAKTKLLSPLNGDD